MSQQEEAVVLVPRSVLVAAVQLLGELPTGSLPFKVVAEVVSQLQSTLQPQQPGGSDAGPNTKVPE